MNIGDEIMRQWKETASSGADSATFVVGGDSPWISVNDRLPDEGEPDDPCTEYLVYRGHGFYDLADYACGFGDNGSTLAVTHWMPLPEPPK